MAVAELVSAAEESAERAAADSTTVPLPAPRPHLRHLDGLRGLAILAVLMIHTEQLIGGLSRPVRDLTFYGVRGVQLFFIVSGLTLTLNYAGKPFTIATFAARRFFRIAPMFYVGIVLYLALSRWTAMPLPTRAASVTDVIATILFVHGWVPSAINTVVPGGWSIAAEAMFYVIFPLLLVAARRRGVMLGAVIASYLLAGATYLFLRRAVGHTPEGANFALEFWLCHAPAFVGGCWLATLPAPTEGTARLAKVALPASIVALLVDSQLRAQSNLLVAIALLTLLAWSASAVRPRWLEAPLLVLIGQVSFSLYILQFAVLGAMRPIAPGVERALGANLALIALYLGALAVTGVLSWLTYRWIEWPVVQATRRIGAPSISRNRGQV